MEYMSRTLRDSVMETWVIFEDTGLLHFQFSQPTECLKSFENLLEINCKISFEEHFIEFC